MAQITLNQLTPSQLRVLQDVLDQCAAIDNGQAIEVLTHVVFDLDVPAHLRPTWREAVERIGTAVACTPWFGGA